jgi:hypothetical protein
MSLRSKQLLRISEIEISAHKKMILKAAMVLVSGATLPAETRHKLPTKYIPFP